MARILVIDHKVATPDQDAGSLRMVNLIRVLIELEHRVTYLPQTLTDRDERRRYSDLAETLPFQRSAERTVPRHLRLHRSAYDATVLCRLGPTERFLPRVRRLCPNTKVIFDTVDLHHLRELRQSEIEGDPNLRKTALDVRRRELQMVDGVDATLVVSTAEEEILRGHHPEARIRVVPTIHELLDEGPAFEHRRGLIFIAGFLHAPNVDGARWLVSEIMPQIWSQLPELPLTLVGSHPPPEILALQSDLVEVTGTVPDLTPYLNRARLSLAPLRFGAGVKGKITHSMAAGLPVVATRLACEGMPIEDERDILMAEGPGPFVDGVIRVYGDQELWQRFADRGREVVARYFSFGTASKTIGGLLGELVNHSGPTIPN